MNTFLEIKEAKPCFHVALFLCALQGVIAKSVSKDERVVQSRAENINWPMKF